MAPTHDKPAVVLRPEQELLVGNAEIAAFLRIHERAICGLRKQGLPLVKLGQNHATTRGALLRWLEKRMEVG